MEKRFVLLIVLCIAVFFGWSLLMRAVYPPQPPAKAADKPAAEKPAQAQTPETPPKREAPQVRTVDPERITTLSNQVLTVHLTDRGAGIRDATIRIAGQPQSIPLLLPFEKGVPHLGIQAEGSEVDLLRSTWTVKGSPSDRNVTYLLKLANDIVIEKRFTLEREKHELQMVIAVYNDKPASPQKIQLRMAAFSGLEHDSPYRYDYYGHGFVTTLSGGAHAIQSVPYDLPLKEGKPVEVKVPDAEKDVRRVEWFGLRNRYAAAIVLAPTAPEWQVESVVFAATMQETPPAGKLKALAVRAAIREFEVKDQQYHGTFTLYLGPVRKGELAAVPSGADLLISYGCLGLGIFNPIGQAILWLVNQAHLVTRNFGWAIVLTTFAIRLALFPLSKKSQTSMARMAELQPKMALLRERYPDDPQKLNQETMKMWKENGVNPLSGCFPLLLQMPIFIGLYNVLDISIEFRQAPFVSWIQDLSQPDRLIPFSSPVDLLIFSIAEFNLLPLIMTATWFLQAWMQPRSEDPKMAAQQRMMLFMPVVFGLFCYPLASGLSLYFFVNSLLSMGEMKIIKKFFLPRKGGAAAPAKA